MNLMEPKMWFDMTMMGIIVILLTAVMRPELPQAGYEESYMILKPQANMEGRIVRQYINHAYL